MSKASALLFSGFSDFSYFADDEPSFSGRGDASGYGIGDGCGYGAGYNNGYANGGGDGHNYGYSFGCGSGCGCESLSRPAAGLGYGVSGGQGNGHGSGFGCGDIRGYKIHGNDCFPSDTVVRVRGNDYWTLVS